MLEKPALIPKEVSRKLLEHYDHWEKFTAFVSLGVLIKCISNHQEIANSLGYKVIYNSKKNTVHVQAPGGNHFYYEYGLNMVTTIYQEEDPQTNEAEVLKVFIDDSSESGIRASRTTYKKNRPNNSNFDLGEDQYPIQVSEHIRALVQHHIRIIVPNKEIEIYDLYQDFDTGL